MIELIKIMFFLVREGTAKNGQFLLIKQVVPYSLFDHCRADLPVIGDSFKIKFQHLRPEKSYE